MTDDPALKRYSFVDKTSDKPEHLGSFETYQEVSQEELDTVSQELKERKITFPQAVGQFYGRPTDPQA